MLAAIVVLVLIMACASCLLSVAVALRVKKVIDPLIEEGAFAPSARFPVPAGTKISNYGEFNDVNGGRVSLPTGADGPWILAFQSTSCSGCKSQLPFYREYLDKLNIPRNRVFSFISGEVPGLNEFSDGIGEFATVVHSGDSTQVENDLNITTWPTYLVVSPDGTVVWSGTSAAALPDLETSPVPPSAVA